MLSEDLRLDCTLPVGYSVTLPSQWCARQTLSLGGLVSIQFC